MFDKSPNMLRSGSYLKSRIFYLLEIDATNFKLCMSFEFDIKFFMQK